MDLPFDRTNIGLRERPVSSDINRAESQVYRTITDLMQQLIGGGATSPHSGFIGGGLSVSALSPAAMSVQVTPGIGFVYDATDLPSNIGATDLEAVDDLSPYKPLVLMGPVQFAVPAAPIGPNTRIDIIEVRVNRLLVDSTPREQLDVPSKTFLAHNFYKTLTFALDGFSGSVASPAASVAAISYKIGTAAFPGLAPATTPGYIKLCEINVGSGVVVINPADIIDKRTKLSPAGAYIGRQMFAANGVYTPTPGATRARVRMVGGGGGGGGVIGAGPTMVAVSGGGASGRYLELNIASVPLTGGAVVVGGAGAGGLAGANGGDGGDTTILINGTTYTAKGGGGGKAAPAAAASLGGGGTVLAGSSAGDAISGSHGAFGWGTETGGAAAFGGNGGSNPLGGGGHGGANVDGSAGVGFGAGGGGTSNTLAANNLGGAGTAGVVYVDEWF